MKILLNHLLKTFMFVFYFSFSNTYGQNLISVPFADGFLGVNTANNASTPAYKLSAMGISSAQFAQNTNGGVFVAQGNDIIGMVFLTDVNGVEHTIQGFIKWRAPSGQVTTMVFQPATNTNVQIATNGVNGSSTYNITSTIYIGLTFNGKTLSLSNGGTVNGNAATSGLLDELNTYLGTLPSISINDLTVNENAGTITLTVTLSVSSSNTVSVRYRIIDSTALVSNDYTSTSYNGIVSFSPGQLTKTITLSIIDDLIAESTERIKVTLEDPVNTSIVKSLGLVSILDNESTLPVEMIEIYTTCTSDIFTLEWSTASEKNSNYFEIQMSNDLEEWSTVGNVKAAGNATSLNEYSFSYLNKHNVHYTYTRINQVDINGEIHSYDPIHVHCISSENFIQVYPNPIKENTVNVRITQSLVSNLTISVKDQFGHTLYSEEYSSKQGNTTFPIQINELKNGVYFVEVNSEEYNGILKIVK